MIRTRAIVGTFSLGTVGVVLALLVPSAVVRAGDDKSSVETIKIATARGATLEGELHKPLVSNAFNTVAIVVGPGQGGGRETPVPKKAAEAFAAAGFPVVRFDWAFFTAGRKTPSEDLADEVADLDAAVAFARKVPRVTKVVIAGKSLGTLAAVKRMEKTPDDAVALLLFTLPLSQGDPANTPLGDVTPLLHSKVPMLVVVGDHDALCPLEMLYEFAAKADLKPRIVVVPGNHGLAKSKDDASQTDENVGLAVAAGTLWARRLVGP